MLWSMNAERGARMAVTAGVLAPGRTRSKGLSREIVIERALDIVDAEGLGGLTMRRLAADLDVGVATVYSVMPSKEDLFQALADTVLGELEPVPEGHLTPPEALVDYFLAMHEMLTRHPAVAQLSAVHPVLSSSALRVQENIMELLRDGGLDPEAAANAYSTIGSYVLGFTLTRISRLDGGRRELLATLPEAEFPALRASAPFFATHATDERQFLDGLRSIVAGVFPSGAVTQTGPRTST